MNLVRTDAGIGFPFIETMTPAPVGDLPVEEWADHLVGSTTLARAGIPGSHFTAYVSDAKFDRFVIHFLSVMRRAPRRVPGVADQVPPDGLERRVRRVREPVNRCGRYER